MTHPVACDKHAIDYPSEAKFMADNFSQNPTPPNPTPARTIVRVKVADLKSHPRQARNFRDLTEPQFRELAESMRAHGLNHPIEMLADDTIVCGHQRVRAARFLGWEYIDAVVRQDVADQGPDAVEAHMIRDNMVRRQLGPLEIARCYQRLKDLASNGQPLFPNQDKDLRDKIGDVLGLSGRTLDRLRRLLKTPLEVQDAVNAGRLSIQSAGKVATLPAATQQRIADLICQGTDAAEAVSRFVAQTATKRKEWWKALDEFARCLRRGVDQLAERLGEITGVYPWQIAALRQARDLIGRLLRRAGGAGKRGRPAGKGLGRPDPASGGLGRMRAGRRNRTACPGGRPRGKKPS
jgi:ParB/RepB/Spo0J family partition protein